MDEKQHILLTLKQTADAICATFGKNCEVCIHDLTDIHASITHITGNVTGRSVGAPATDLLIKALQQNNNDPDDMHNYRTTTSDGRVLKSSTIFIRDDDNQVFAAMCINFDTTDFFNASQCLLPFLSDHETNIGQKPETFASSSEETIDALFEQAVHEIGKQPATMNTTEKTYLVELLEQHGAFMFKGAVDQVAFMAGVSKYTIYNYLKKIRTKKNLNHV